MKKQLFFTFLFSLLFSISHTHFDIGKLFSGGNLAYTKPTKVFSNNLETKHKISLGTEYSSGITELNIFGLNNYSAKDCYISTKSTLKPYATAGLDMLTLSEANVAVATSTDSQIIKNTKHTELRVNDIFDERAITNNNYRIINV